MLSKMLQMPACLVDHHRQLPNTVLNGIQYIGAIEASAKKASSNKNNHLAKYLDVVKEIEKIEDKLRAAIDDAVSRIKDKTNGKTIDYKKWKEISSKKKKLVPYREWKGSFEDAKLIGPLIRDICKFPHPTTADDVKRLYAMINEHGAKFKVFAMHATDGHPSIVFHAHLQSTGETKLSSIGYGPEFASEFLKYHESLIHDAADISSLTRVVKDLISRAINASKQKTYDESQFAHYNRQLYAASHLLVDFINEFYYQIQDVVASYAIMYTSAYKK